MPGAARRRQGLVIDDDAVTGQQAMRTLAHNFRAAKWTITALSAREKEDEEMPHRSRDDIKEVIARRSSLFCNPAQASHIEDVRLQPDARRDHR